MRLEPRGRESVYMLSLTPGYTQDPHLPSLHSGQVVIDSGNHTRAQDFILYNAVLKGQGRGSKISRGCPQLPGCTSLPTFNLYPLRTPRHDLTWMGVLPRKT